MVDEGMKKDLALRMKRIEGQIRGIDKMVQEGKYCIDIIHQINAAKRALEQTALMLVQQHVKTCLAEAILQKRGKAKIEELVSTLNQFLR